MTLSHQKFREVVFQLLYSHDVGKSPDEEALIALVMQELAITKRIVQTAYARAKEILAHVSSIDKEIANASLSYEFSRIHSIERNVLRLSVYELLYEKLLPHKVVIAEAIRLSRKFASPESTSFINAILDHLYKSSIGEKPNHATLDEAARQLAKAEEIAREASQSMKDINE